MMNTIMNNERMEAKIKETVAAEVVLRMPVKVLIDAVKDSANNLEDLYMEVKSNGAMIVGTEEDLNEMGVTKEEKKAEMTEKEVVEKMYNELMEASKENPVLGAIVEGIHSMLGVSPELLNCDGDCENCQCHNVEEEADEEEYDCCCDECDYCDGCCDECDDEVCCCDECCGEDEEDDYDYEEEEDGTHAFSSVDVDRVMEYATKDVIQTMDLARKFNNKELPAGAICEMTRVELGASLHNIELINDLYESMLEQTDFETKKLAATALAEVVRHEMTNPVLKDKMLSVIKNEENKIVAVFFPVLADKQDVKTLAFNDKNNKFYLV